MQYVYMALGGLFFIETITVFILAKVCKKRKIAKQEAEQLAETYKRMFEQQEQKFKDITETVIKLKESKNEKVDVNSLSDGDIQSVLSGMQN